MQAWHGDDICAETLGVRQARRRVEVAEVVSATRVAHDDIRGAVAIASCQLSQQFDGFLASV